MAAEASPGPLPDAATAPEIDAVNGAEAVAAILAKRPLSPSIETQRGGRKTDKAKLNARATHAERGRGYTELKLQTLADIAGKGGSETTRVSAARGLLHRGWGKPWQASPTSRPCLRLRGGFGAPAAPAPQEANVVPIFDVGELRRRYG